MINYDYIVTVTGNTAKLDKDIYLFRGNKNVHYYFTVKNASFNFKGSTDLIEKTNAINAAVTVIKPNGVEVANAIAEVENGKIHLKVTEDLIDEEVEVGDFDLVFDLFDDTDGAVTIPKVQGQFHVLERPCTTPISELVVTTNTTNEVDKAIADYAIATYAEPVTSTNADGTFAKKTWVAKEKITTAELNRMEEGIYNNSSQCKDIANKTVIENNKLYLVKSDGTKLDEGTTLPSSSGTSNMKITEEYMIENSFKLHWKGEIFKAPSDYVAWGGNTHYDKTLGKFIHWLYCAPAHIHSTSELYVIYIDKDTLISSEPVRCSFYDTDGTTQINFENEGSAFSVRYIGNNVYEATKPHKIGSATYQCRWQSTDYGKTWVKVGNLSTPSGIAGFDAIVELSNGRLITSYGGPVFYSDDNGASWTISTPATAGGNYEAEAWFCELKPGTVMAIARYSMGGGTAGDGTPDPAIIAYSTDYGTTWTPWKKSKTILDMNAIGCSGIIHDGFIELFVCSRWYDDINKYTETGKHGAIYQYVATIEDALNDNFTNLGIIHYSPGTAQGIMGPNFALDDRGEMLFCIAEGGGSATCTKFFAKGTKTTFYSTIDDVNKSKLSSYSNIQVDKLISELNSKILTLQYALSKIEGSGVTKPDVPEDSIIWTKEWNASDGIQFTDDTNPFKPYLANPGNGTFEKDGLNNDVLSIGDKNISKIVIPSNKDNYVIEVVETIAINPFTTNMVRNIGLVYDDNLNFKNLRSYYTSTCIINETTYKSLLFHEAKDVAVPFVLKKQLIKRGNNIYATVAVNNEICKQENYDVTDFDCGTTDVMSSKGVFIVANGTVKLQSIKFGEW